MTRSPLEIARGLQPVRDPELLSPGGRIHVIGAGGAAGAGSLLLARACGLIASGCDAAGPSPYTPAVEAAGIELAWRNEPGHVVLDGRPRVDRIAVSKALTSVEPDHAELRAARIAGIPATSLQQLIADGAATRAERLIAVTGTHGKSTTAGWIVHLLEKAGRDPSAFVGALLPAPLAGAQASTVRLGNGPDFVVEADEYAGNFDPYRPRIGVLVTADWDHPDVFSDRSAVEESIEAWIRRFDGRAEPPVLIANASDAGVREILAGLADWPGRIVATHVTGEGREEAGDDVCEEAPEAPGVPVARADRRQVRSALGPAQWIEARYRPEAGGAARLVISGGGWVRAEATLRLFGRHMADDGLVAAAAALLAGCSRATVLAGLASFGGVGRRFELKGEVGGVAVVDDYAHHPRAIAATLAAARLRFPGRRIWAVHEPLTFHRTAAMAEAFADVLAGADEVVVADIFPVRDPDTSIASAAELAGAVSRRWPGRQAAAPGTAEATADHLAGAVREGDVVLVMGGGRSYLIAERLVALLEGRVAGRGGGQVQRLAELSR